MRHEMFRLRTVLSLTYCLILTLNQRRKEVYIACILYSTSQSEIGLPLIMETSLFSIEVNFN